jgi:hypothetical protein
MRVGRWVLALAAVSLLFCGTANAQIQANELCIHNGGEYYTNGGFFCYPNHGGGKYFAQLTHIPQRDLTDPSDGEFEWEIGGWFFVGMQASNAQPSWYWESCLQYSVAAEFATTMSFDHPLLFCQEIISHVGFPMPIYGGYIDSSVPTLANHGWLYPSSAGGLDNYFNIFAVGTGTFDIPSTQPFYGWQFGWFTGLDTPCASAITVPSMTSIWQYAWSCRPETVVGQYLILSGNEMDCLGQGGLGNKARNYSVISDYDNGFLWYWVNTCPGVGQEYAMCLWVCDAVCIPLNIPGSTNAANPYANYGYDIGTGSITPYMTSGSWQLGFHIQDYHGFGSYLCIGAFHTHIWVYFKKGRARVQFDIISEILLNANLFVVVGQDPYPAYWGETPGGASWALPFPPDPVLKCALIKWWGHNAAGAWPSAAFLTTLF